MHAYEQEPDQIDMMNEQELRIELRAVLLELSEATKRLDYHFEWHRTMGFALQTIIDLANSRIELTMDMNKDSDYKRIAEQCLAKEIK